MYRLVPSSITLAGLQLLGNLQPVVVETDESVLTAVISISAGSSSLANIPLSYTPAGGRVSIDLQDILRPYFSFEQVPAGDRFIWQTRMLLSVSVRFMQETSAGLVLSVLRGAATGITGGLEEWCRANPLTWQSRRKYVLGPQPEYLTLYLKRSDTVSFSIYTRKGAGPTKAVSGQSVQVQQTGVYTFDVSPAAMSAIAAIEEGAHIAYYDVETAGGAKMQYVLDLPRSEDERWFLWENSLGGIDTMRMFGDESVVLASEDKTIARKDATTTYDVESPRTWRQDTGTLSLRERTWLLDFFRSPNRYVFRGGVLYPIVLTEAGGEGLTSDSVSNYTFTYRLSDDKGGLNVSLLNDTPPSLVLPPVAPSDFLLPPHPSNLEPLSPGEGVLFPALLNNAWGVIGYNQLMSGLQSGLQPYIDKLIKDYITWYLSQEGHNSSAPASILTSFQSQLKILRLQAEELKRNPILADIVRVALTEADQRAQAALDALREFFATHHTIDSDAEEKIVAVEDALAYFGKVIFIAQKSLTDKLTDQMLQQLNVVSQENNTTALGYATEAQQHAFHQAQAYTDLTAASIDQSITAAQSLEVFIRSSEGILLQQEPTSTMSVGVRLNGKDITDQVLAMVPAVNFVWHRKSKTGKHEGMTDAEWDAYALGRHEVTIKRAFKHKLRFWLETSKEDDERIIEQFKHKRI